MLEELKHSVCSANIELFRQRVVRYTWGNVSGIDRDTNLVVIKPSGISYDLMNPQDMVVVDLNGNIIEGKYKPSSDTFTHLEIYKAFPSINGIAHTHSTKLVAYAQAGRAVPIYGTTHADLYCDDIPCTRELLKEEVETDYEKNTGLVIVELLKKYNNKPPGVLVKSHGPFSWGDTPEEAVKNIVTMELVAEMAIYSEFLNEKICCPTYITEKHFNRKHGKNAYYGQISNKGT